MGNKYIFITMSICDIGGAEQYIYNKINFLKSKGYDVLVFSGMNRKIMVSEFEEYSTLIFPPLMYSPIFFKDSEILNTLLKMQDIISYDDGYECIIESTGVAASKWAEMLAKRLSCKHILFNLQEIHNYSEEEKTFLRFKLNYMELAGITSKSVKMMLNDDSVQYGQCATIKAFCSNVVDDYKECFSSSLLLDADLTFGSIGRLEKKFVIPMLLEVAEYARINSNKYYNLLLIGGTRKKRVIYTIKGIFSNIENVNLVITGFVFPIPRSLISKVDLFISTAGSANVSYMEGKPTIKVHPVSGAPVGILGYSYDSKVDTMYDVQKNKKIIDIINFIQKDNIIINYPKDPYKSFNKEMAEEFERQLAIASNANNNYYETRFLQPVRTKKRIIYSMLGKTMGGTIMQEILELIRKFK